MRRITILVIAAVVILPGFLSFWPQSRGFYAWESLNGGEAMRWTRKKAVASILIQEPYMILPVLVKHPDIKSRPVELIIAVNGENIKKVLFKKIAWYDIVLPVGKYMGNKVRLILVLDRVWKPSDYDSLDFRELGVMVGEIRWRHNNYLQSDGFYHWEKGIDGTNRRWSEKEATVIIETLGNKLMIPIELHHPDVESMPVKVDVCLQSIETREITFDKMGKRILEFDIPDKIPDNQITINFSVSRTWNPFKYHISNDNRDLGVFVDDFYWE